MPAGTEAAVFAIDRNTSRFVVRAYATGLLSAMGHSPTIAIRDFSGDARLEPEPSLKVRVRADSLEVTDDIPTKDKREIEKTMHEDVLQSAKFPEILYESTSSTSSMLSEGRWQINLTGNLTLRGVTRSQNLSMQVTRMGTMLRGNGEFTILQSSFGIKPVSVVGGTLKLKDELKFTLDVVARQQDEEPKE